MIFQKYIQMCIKHIWSWVCSMYSIGITYYVLQSNVLTIFLSENILKIIMSGDF